MFSSGPSINSSRFTAYVIWFCTAALLGHPVLSILPCPLNCSAAVILRRVTFRPSNPSNVMYFAILQHSSVLQSRKTCAATSYSPCSFRIPRNFSAVVLIDWCCFYCFVRNSLVALLEVLCVRSQFASSRSYLIYTEHKHDLSRSLLCSTTCMLGEPQIRRYIGYYCPVVTNQWFYFICCCMSNAIGRLSFSSQRIFDIHTLHWF